MSVRYLALIPFLAMGLQSMGAIPAVAHGHALLVHGNYCGPGNNGVGIPPTDALDAACARHDACTPAHALPSCACNARLQRESALISGDPRQPAGLRSTAGLVSFAAGAMACLPGSRLGGRAYTYPGYVSPSYGQAGPDVVEPYDPYAR